MSLLSRIKGMMARCILEVLSEKGYEVSILSGEKSTEVEHLQEFGMASLPPAGARGILARLGGNANNPTVLIFEHPEHKPDDLVDGESVIYNAHDMQIYLREDGTIRVTGGGFTKMVVDGNLEVNGTILATETITSEEDCISDNISGKTHEHPINGGSSAPGPTGPPNP